MSTVIDEKVVEMRFDNKQFEAGVQTSLGTLDKLKNSLKFGDASKSLENLSKAAGQCDMSSLEKSASSVSERFSALETIAVGALLKIGSQAVTTGEQLLKSLTVDQIAAGWEKYSDKTTAVQTIMAATGKSIDEVNGSLEKLIWFTDETSYSMTDMTSNIGKFTSQGIDLDTAVTAMEGISTWASLSGGSISEASRAMYNLSQALGVGAVKLQDWKSIENANMATKEFKELAMEAAVATGDLTKSFDTAGNAIYQTSKGTAVTAANFSSTLSDAWFSSNALIRVLNNYGNYADGIYELYNNLGEGVEKTTSEIIGDMKRLRGADDQTILNAGYTEDQIELVRKLSKEIGGIGQKSFAAAQEAKTFKEVIDSVKEAVASGWSQTFETIFGNYEEAKVFWTDLSNNLWDVFASGGEARNELLGRAFNFSGFDRLAITLNNAGMDLDVFYEKLNDISSSKGISLDDLISQYGSLDSVIQNGVFSTDELHGAVKKCAEALNIANIDEMKDAIDAAIGSVDELSGRQHLISAFWNTWEGIGALLSTVKEAFREIFPEKTASQIYNFVKGLDELTARFKVFLTESEKGQKFLTNLKSTFKGVFAVIDIVKQAFSAIYRTISPLIGKIFGLGDSVLGVTGSIGEWLARLDESIKENDVFFKGLQKIVDIIRTVGNAIVDFAKKVGSDLRFPSFEDLRISIEDFFNEVKGRFNNGGLERINAFIDRLKALDGLSFKNVKIAFKDFKDNIVDYFFGFTKAFDDVDLTVSGIGGSIKNVFETVYSSAETAKNKTKTVLEALVEFFKTAKEKIFNVVLELRSKIADKFGFSEIFAIGIGAGIVAFMKRISDAVEAIAAPFEGFGAIMKGTSKILKSYATEIKTEALKNVAEAILILVGALAVLTLLDQDKLMKAVVVLGILAAGIAALTFAMSKIGKPTEIAGLSLSLLSLGASLLMIAGAMKKLEALESPGKAFLVITGLMGELLVVAKLISSQSKSFSVSLVSLIGFVVSLKLLVGVMKDIDRLNISDPGKTITVLLGMVAGLIAISAACKNVKFSAGAGILSMIIALKLLIGTFDEISKFNATEIKTALNTISTIFVLFAGVMVASKFAGENASKAGSAILKMSAALLLITASFKIMEKLDQSSLERSKKTIAELLVVFALVTAVSNFAGKNATKAGTMLLAMSGALILVSAAMTLLSHLDPSGLDRALDAITQLLLVFGALIGITKLSGEAGKMQSTIITLTISIGVLTAAVAALTMLDPERLEGATTALSELMAIFGLVLAATKIAGKASGSMVVLALVVAGIAGILTVMSSLNVESSIQNATAISILLTAMSGALLILSKTGSIAPTAYAAIGVMTLVVAGLATILGLMSKFNVQSSIETAEGLSILLLSMSAACLALSAVGATGPAAFIGIGALATLIAAIGGIMAAISALTSDHPTVEEDLDRAIMVMEKIGTAIGSFAGGIIGGVMSGISSTLPQIGSDLSAFMTNIQPFIDGGSKITSDLLSGIATLTGAILLITAADILEGLTSWLTGGSSLADFGNELVPFGESMVAFSNTISGLDADLVDKAATAGKTLAEMAATLPNSGGILGFFTGNNDMDVFGEQLIVFGEAMMGFSSVVQGLDVEAVQNAATAGKVMSEMAGTLPNTGGVVSWFTGNNDMDDFGEQLIPFGKAMKEYSIVVQGLDVAAVENSATAGKALVELANTVPNTGGVVSWFTGNNDMDDFGAQIVPFGKAMKEYSDAVIGLDTEVIVNSTTAGQALVELAKTVPNTGGVVSWFTGDNDLATFGTQILVFGTSMNAYAAAVAGIDAGAVTASTTAGQSLVELANTLPKCGGLISIFTGNNDLAKFGDNIVSFGEDLAAYAKAIGNVNPKTVSASANAAKALSDLATGLPDSSIFDKWFGGDQTLVSFGKDISEFGASMGEYYSNISTINVDTLSRVVDGIWEIVDLTKGIKNIDTGTMTGFGKALKTMADNSIDDFVKAFTNSNNKVTTAVNGMLNAVGNSISSNKSLATKGMQDVIASLSEVVTQKASEINASVSNIMSGVSNAILSSMNQARSAMQSVMGASVSVISNYYGQFFSAGSYCGQGLIDGIRSKISSASSAGWSLGRASLEAAMRAVDSRSPSKEFIRLGGYMGEGLVMGINNSISSTSDAGWSLGRAPLDSAKKALDSHSPSKEFISLGKNIGDGLAIGIKNSSQSSENASAGMGQKVVDAAKNTLSNVSGSFENWLDSYVDMESKASATGIEKLDDYQTEYIAASKERIQTDQYEHDRREELSKSSYENSMNWIENEKKNNRLSLVDELAAYKRVQSRYAAGTEERENMDREVYRVEKEIYEAQKQYSADVQRVQEEANQKRIALEDEYADKVTSINERLASDIKNLNDQYESTLNSRTNSLYQSYGLFDEVKEREEVSGATLLDNLQGQVEEFNEWQRTLDSLSARGLDEELIKELSEMGPSAIAQVKALEAMSDSELNRYVGLWRTKHALARQQAVNELEGLRIETQNNIVQLRIDAERELEDYRATWQEKMHQIDIDANAELERLRRDFEEKLGLIKKDTEAETQEMVDVTQKILEEAGWDKTGQRIVIGLKQGVEEEKPSFINALTQMASEGVTAVKDELDINSPSRVFRTLGNFTGLGFVKGITDYANKSYEAGSYIADETKSGLSDAMSTISNYLNGDMEMQPTIRPVMDLSDVANGVGMIDSMFYSRQMLALAGQTSFGFSANAGNTEMNITVNNDGVVQELHALRGEMAEMTERIAKMQFILDTGTLIGEMVDGMDNALGQRQSFRGRGI